MKAWICFFISFGLVSTMIHSELLINTNTIDYSKVVTNNDTITNEDSITNISSRTVREPELPNNYLKNGIIEFTPSESKARRTDVVFFIAVPITYYLTLNLLQLKNMYFIPGRGAGSVDDADMNYIYINTLILPLLVSYFDSMFVDNQEKSKDTPVTPSTTHSSPISYNILRFSINF